MAKTIKYKDTSGNIQTVAFDTNYPIEVTTLVDTTWTLKTTDPTNGTLTTDYLGGRPKR